MKHKYFIQTITFIAIFCMNCMQPAFSAEFKKVNSERYRANLLYVRLLPEAKEFESLQSISRNGYCIERRLLPIENAARYSPKVFDKIVAKRLSTATAISAEDKLLRTFIVRYDGDENPKDKAEKILNEFPNIEIAEPIVIDDICGEFMPNDPMAGEQEMFQTMHLLEAWDMYKGDSTVVIVISDSGVLQEHEDLAGNLFCNKNEIPNDGIDNDGNGYIDDYNGLNLVYQIDGSSPASTFNSREGHGTGTAGISSAVCNNGLGIAGCGFNTKFFPIKTMPDTDGGIMYGYEAIIYAANMGFDVVNCSWGSLSYSDVNKSVIDYAVSRGVAIVAAAGNHGTVEQFYPACYPGVLGVGVTNPRDSVISMSAYGTCSDIMAPGQETKTTSNDGTYGTFCCTSGAAPIISAQVAMVRAKHPELDNLQALEFARVSSDDIEQNNPKKYNKLIPHRVNFLKTVSDDPMQTKAIAYSDFSFYAKGQPDNTRFSLDDTVELKINFKNYLAEIDTITCRLSVVGDSLGALKTIDTLLTGGRVKTNSEFYLGDFAFSIETLSRDIPFLRVDIESGDYEDYFLIPFLPYRTFTTFSNDAVVLTACDNGRIAYNDFPRNTQGSGFKQKGKASVIYEGAFVATGNGGRVVTQARKDKELKQSDFAPMKPYLAPNENIAIFTDGFAPDSMKLGISVENIIELPEGNKKYAQIYVKIKNTAQEPLQELAAGYFLDFDLGTAKHNLALPTEELVPPTMRDGKTIAAKIFDAENEKLLCAVAVTSNYDNVFPQFASFDGSDITEEGFALDKQHLLLNSGTYFVTEDPKDIATIVGMKFMNEIPSGDSVSFVITLAIADSALELRNTLWNALDPTVSAAENNGESDVISIYPIPAKNELVVSARGINEVMILDINGKQQKNVSINNRNAEKFVFNISNLPTGTYFIKLISETGIYNKKFIKL